MPRYYNCIGALAWVATRDDEAAGDLNRYWNSAKTDIAKVTAAFLLDAFAKKVLDQRKAEQPTADNNQLDEAPLVEAPIDKAKAEIIDKCREAELVAFGHCAANEETRPVPDLSWQGVEIDEVRSTINKQSATWLGIRFKAEDVQRLWPVGLSGTALRPKAVTGPKSQYSHFVERIYDQYHYAMDRAIERDEALPGRPTSDQIAAKISEITGHEVKARTIRHTVNRLFGKDGPQRTA